MNPLDYHVLSCVKNYAGEILEAQPKPKTVRELKIALKLAPRFMPGTHQKSFAKRLGTCVGHSGFLVVDKLNRFCYTLFSVFYNTYFRCGFKNKPRLRVVSFATLCYVICFLTIIISEVRSLQLI